MLQFTSNPLIFYLFSSHIPIFFLPRSSIYHYMFRNNINAFPIKRSYRIWKLCFKIAFEVCIWSSFLMFCFKVPFRFLFNVPFRFLFEFPCKVLLRFLLRLHFQVAIPFKFLFGSSLRFLSDSFLIPFRCLLDSVFELPFKFLSKVVLTLL